MIKIRRLKRSLCLVVEAWARSDGGMRLIHPLRLLQWETNLYRLIIGDVEDQLRVGRIACFAYQWHHIVFNVDLVVL